MNPHKTEIYSGRLSFPFSKHLYTIFCEDFQDSLEDKEDLIED